MRKLICFALAIFLSLSLFSCAKTNSGNVVSQSAPAAEIESEPNYETSSKDKNSSTVAPTPNHKHKYKMMVKTQSCGQAGGNEYTCACGDSYMENRVAPSYKHEFQEESISFGESSRKVYVCKNCGLQALYVAEWWEYRVLFDELRWYVTGKINIAEDGKGYYESDYEIVVCGNGAISDFNEKTGDPPWQDFLGSKLKSITVEGGITSIGKNAFNYRTSKKREVSFNIGGSVKTIKSGAIKLNIYDIALSGGVEVIEKDAISGVKNIYLPESVKVCSDLGSRSNTCYYYEGDHDALLKIRVENPGIPGDLTCTLKEYCDWNLANDQNPNSVFTVILNSHRIRKGNALFDGKTVKTDYDSLKSYIK